MTLEILEAYHKLKDTIRTQDDIIVKQGKIIFELKHSLKGSYNTDQLREMLTVYAEDSIYIKDEYKKDLYNKLGKSND